MILQRYLIGEYARMFATIIGGLIVVYFSTRLASYLGQAADGKIAPAHIAVLLLLKMLISLRDLIPMSLFLAIFATIVRFQRDSELTAIRAAGGGHLLLLTAALKLAAVAAVAVAVLTLYAEPKAEEVIQQIKDATENEATIAGVKAGRFKELSGGKRIFYAEQVAPDEMTLKKAFVQVRNGADVGLLRSANAYVETDKTNADRFAVFLDGTSYAGRPGALDYVITDFAKYALKIESRAPADLSNEVNYMPTVELLKYNVPGFRAEFAWRIARPVGALLLPLLAVLIGLVSTGDSWYWGLLTAVAGYFIYSNLLNIGHALVKKGVLHPDLGLWLIQLILVTVIGAMYWYQRRPQSRRTQSPLARA